MKPTAWCRASFIAFVLPLLGLACSKKGPECQTLIGSMNDLGSKLSEAQKVTSNNEAKPEQVAAALRPFALTAKSTGEKLAKSELTVSEIRKIATDASAAALALASNAAQMADAAEQMKGIDAASKAVDDQRKLVDGAESEIKKLCEASAAQCVELAKVMAAFPPPPDKTDNMQLVGAWATKLNTWAADLAKVEVKNEALKGQIANFGRGWKSCAAAMTTLVGISETAKKYDEFANAFNAQIDIANKAIGSANAFCRS
jgi:hypothetical protein